MPSIRQNQHALELLRSRGLRATPERRALLGAIFAQRRHQDAEGVGAAVRASGHTISRATVYRNLDLLAAHGLVDRFQVGARTVFEAHRPGRRHDLLICRDCGRVLELDLPAAAELLAAACAPQGFVSDEAELHIVGRCRSCAGGERRESDRSDRTDRSRVQSHG